MEVAHKVLAVHEADILRKSLKIGMEYVIELRGKGFLDNNLYFTCLLCSSTQKHEELDAHMTSAPHRMEFLVSSSFMFWFLFPQLANFRRKILHLRPL
jgi:hypothetical protein